jgi:acyl carrier protein
MNREEAMRAIEEALKKVLKKEVAVSPETDLIAEEILDSLDGMTFAMEIEDASGKKFPEDLDLVEAGYYKVENLIEFLTKP